ncbi:unnamed protein product [Discula destructiva]
MALTGRAHVKPYAAEFLGTLLLVLIGDGVVAQCLLSDYTYGTWLSINLAWASAVVLTTFIGSPPPSCNPAITLAGAFLRPSFSRSSWRTLPLTLLAQFAGGFAGAALVYAQYRAAIARWDPELTVPWGSILSPQGHASAGIFATYPSADLASNWDAALTEGIGAGVLMFGVLAINDDSSSRREGRFALFALLLAIGAAAGWQTGYAVNPARDLGPRLFSAFVYGREVFTAKGCYFLVPLFAPVVGCLTGATVYDALLFEGRGSVVTDGLDKLERKGWFGGRGWGSIRLEEDDEVDAPGAWRE